MSSKSDSKAMNSPFADLEKSMSESASDLGKNINTLFKAMQTEKDERVLIAAFTSAYKAFLSHKKKIKLPVFSNFVETSSTGEKQVNQFGSWLQQTYQRFLQLLFKLFRHKKELVRQAAMKLLVENIFPGEASLWALKGEPVFPIRLLERVFVDLIQLPADTPAITNTLIELFTNSLCNQWADGYVHIGSCIRQWGEQRFAYRAPKEGEKSPATAELSNRVAETSTVEDQSAVVFSLLMRLQAPSKQANVAKQAKGIKGKVVKNIGSDDKVTRESLAPTGRDILVSEERKAYQDSWLSLAKAPGLAEGVIRGLLGVITTKVMPYLSSPLQTADLYIRAYDVATEQAMKNNLIEDPRHTPFSRTIEEMQSKKRQRAIVRAACTRVAALSGLFSLIARFKLGDTDVVGGRKAGDSVQDEEDLAAQAADSFFVRLYKCVSPSTLRVEGAAEPLIKLLDLSLRSNLVPHKLKAAFCKKLARAAMLVPASSALPLLAIVAFLMQRNKASLRGLVDVSREASHMWASTQGDAKFEFSSAPIFCDAATAADAVDQEEAAEDARVMLEKRKVKEVHAASSGRKIGAAMQMAGPEGYAEDADLLDEEAEVLREAKRQRFLKDESGMEKSLEQLAQISLWELQALRRHINPEVGQVAAFFWSDFLNVILSRPVDVGAALGHSEVSLLEQQLKQRITSLPAVAVQPPRKLTDLDQLFEAMEFIRQGKEESSDEEEETGVESAEEQTEVAELQE